MLLFLFLPLIRWVGAAAVLSSSTSGSSSTPKSSSSSTTSTSGSAKSSTSSSSSLLSAPSSTSSSSTSSPGSTSASLSSHTSIHSSTDTSSASGLHSSSTLTSSPTAITEPPVVGYGTTWTTPLPYELWSYTTMVSATGIIGEDPRWDNHLFNPYWILDEFTVPRPVGDPANLTSPAVRAMNNEYRYCSPIYDSYILSWASTATWTTEGIAARSASTTETPVIDASDAGGLGVFSSTQLRTQYKSWEKFSTTTGPSRVFTWTAYEPCCRECSLYGGSVQVFYWPSTVSNHESRISTIVSDGFTFKSPSVYVGFRSVAASNWCGNIGLRNNAPTLSFSANELSTARGYLVDPAKYATPPVEASFVPATWEEQKHCNFITTSFYQIPGGNGAIFTDAAAASIGLSSYNSELLVNTTTAIPSQFSQLMVFYTASYNPCSPTVQIPESSFTLTNPTNSQLTYCYGQFGFYDPPSALQSAPALATSSAVEIQAAPITTAATTTQAVPGSSPAQTSAPVTTPEADTQPTSISSVASVTEVSIDLIVVAKPTPTSTQDPTSSTVDLAVNNPSPTSISTVTAASTDVLPVDAAVNPSPTSIADPASPISTGTTGTKALSKAPPAIISSAASGIIIGDGIQELSVILGASTDSPSIVVGSSTIALSVFAATATSGASIVVGGVTQALSTFLAEITGGAAATKTATIGLAGVILSLGGLGDQSTTASAATTSYLQVGGGADNGTYDGPIFLGAMSNIRRENWLLTVAVLLSSIFLLLV